jgi:hypothetical protein
MNSERERKKKGKKSSFMLGRHLLHRERDSLLKMSHIYEAARQTCTKEGFLRGVQRERGFAEGFATGQQAQSFSACNAVKPFVAGSQELGVEVS